MAQLNPTQIAAHIDWEPNLKHSSDLEKRYAHWIPLAGLRDPQESYDFHNVGAFYDQHGACYYLADTTGCSCYTPWDDGTANIHGPYSAQEAIHQLRTLINDTYTAFRPEDVTRATQAIRDHHRTTTPSAEKTPASND